MGKQGFRDFSGALFLGVSLSNFLSYIIHFCFILSAVFESFAPPRHQGSRQLLAEIVEEIFKALLQSPQGLSNGVLEQAKTLYKEARRPGGT